MDTFEKPMKFQLKNVENHSCTLKNDRDIRDSLLNFKRDYCDFWGKNMVKIFFLVITDKDISNVLLRMFKLSYKTMLPPSNN